MVAEDPGTEEEDETVSVGRWRIECVVRDF